MGDSQRTGNSDGAVRRRSSSRDRHTEKRKRSRYDDDHRRDSRKAARESDSPEREYRQKRRSISPPKKTSQRDGSEDRERDYRRRKDEGYRRREHSGNRRRSTSPSRDHSSKHRRRRSPSPSRRKRSPSPYQRSRQPLPTQDETYRGQEGPDESAGALEKVPEKQKPNFRTTGLLAAETNKVSVGGGAGNQPKSIVLKYHEPAEARKPPSSQPWSVYVFKGDSPDPIQTIPLHTRSCWLLGRETAVADIPTEHPSCSKQHAVFQFRHVTKKDEWGEKKGKVGLYILDLESANGTFLNGERIEAARYIECLNNDVVKFGESQREFVILLPTK